MGHGKNKHKNQKVGLGQQPKETREERRLRIEEEAKAREVRLPRLVAINKDGYVVSLDTSIGSVSVSAQVHVCMMTLPIALPPPDQHHSSHLKIVLIGCEMNMRH